MDKNLFEKGRIKECVFLFSFAPQFSIERDFADFEKELREMFEQGATLTRVPEDAPVNIPRFILSSRKKRSLEVSITGCLLKLSPQDMDAEDAVQYFMDRSRKILKYLTENNKFFIEKFKISIISDFQVKDNSSKIDSIFFEQFIKINEQDGTTLPSFKFNKISDNYLYKIEFSTYEIREATYKFENDMHKIKHGNSFFMKIKNFDMPIKHRGINQLIDIEIIDDFTQTTDINAVFNKIIDDMKKEITIQQNIILG